MDERREVRQAFRGRVIAVEVHPRPGGPYDIVRHPGAAGVLPITPGGDVVLVRQERPAIGQVLTEIPAGLLDREGEDALSCAARELLEETGFAHRTIEFLGGYFSSAGFTDEYVHLFVATTEPEPVGTPEEGIEVLRMPLAELVRAARSGQVRDVKTALAALLADARGLGGGGGGSAPRVG